MKASKFTAVDFIEDLSSPYARNRFFLGLLVLGAICMGVIWLGDSQLPIGILKDAIHDVAANLLASVLIILGFYILYISLIGPNTGLTEVVATRPQDIRMRLESLHEGSRNYMFWGRSGSYFRSAPLLKLDEQARAKKLITDIDVVLPDPTDERLVKSYREILTSLGENPPGNPLLANVLATTMACAIIGANNKYVRVRMYYSKFLPAFRVDMSESGAILTQDDPAKSALFFEGGSEFHEMFRTTIRNEMSLSTEVKWDAGLFVGRKLDEKSCDKETLSAFGIPVTDVDTLQNEVARLITSRPHRYK